MHYISQINRELAKTAFYDSQISKSRKGNNLEYKNIERCIWWLFNRIYKKLYIQKFLSVDLGSFAN